MRSIWLLLLLIVALALALQGSGHDGSRPTQRHSYPAKQEQVERELTLLDVWAQTLVPGILLQHSQARALRVGDLTNAVRLERPVLRGLVKAEGFKAQVADDPTLRTSNSVDVRAVRAAADAWGDWATAVLLRPHSWRGNQARLIAGLEARAVELHQVAYAVVDASLKTALAKR